MNKILLALSVFGLMGCVASASAQSLSGPLSTKKTAVFSPALFNADLWNRKKTGGSSSSQTVAPTSRRTYVLKYNENVTELTDEQKMPLLETVKRFTTRKTSAMELIGAAKEESVAAVRIQKIKDFVLSNNTSPYPSRFIVKIVPVGALTPNTDNTVKIIEHNQ